MLVLRAVDPDWYNKTIHESSPGSSGVSVLLRNTCRAYVPTHYFPGVALGTAHQGYRCEDLEKQTFEGEAFDLVITQDVLEHVFDPAAVHREIWRTLKPGGCHVFTTPIYKHMVKTKQCARLRPDGSVEHLEEPEYHGNPSDPEGGSLVTYRYGYDIADLIAEWAPFDVEIRRFNDRTRGIIAEFSEVIVCRKREAD
jgi:SAM-dependent methyltransferase